MVPAGWVITPEGVFCGSSADLPAIPCPLLISRRLTEIDGRIQSVEVVWFRDGVWTMEVVLRETIAKARTVVDLSAWPPGDEQ